MLLEVLLVEVEVLVDSEVEFELVLLEVDSEVLELVEIVDSDVLVVQ